MGTFSEILPCLGGISISLVCLQVSQLLKRLSMQSPEQLAFALTCGGVAWLLLWRQNKVTAKAEKRAIERRKQLNGWEKKTQRFTPSRRKSNNTSISFDQEPPLSASKLKFIPTPEVETLANGITRPARTTTKQHSSWTRSTRGGYIEKPVPVRKVVCRTEGSPGEQDISWVQPELKPKPAPRAPLLGFVFSPTPTSLPPSTGTTPKRARWPETVPSPKPIPSPKTAPSPKAVPSLKAVPSPKIFLSPRSTPSQSARPSARKSPSPKPAATPQTSLDPHSMKPLPFQAATGTTGEQNSEVYGRRRSSAFEISPYIAAQLAQLDPSGASPELVYNAICVCLNQSGVTQPSPFQIHMALSLLKQESDQAFYDYLNLKQAEQLQGYESDEKALFGLCQPRLVPGPEEVNNEGPTEDSRPFMSGAVQPADSRILDPQTRRRPKYVIPDNDGTVCDKSLSFDQQLQFQPFRLISKRDLSHVWSFEPRYCLRYISDEYYTTNLGLIMIAQKVREADERVEAVLPLISTESDRVGILQDYDRQVVSWLYRLGGRFNHSQKTCLERGSVRYADDLIPYSDDDPDFRVWTEEEVQYWGALWDRAAQFWNSVGFAGEYDRHGYIPENGSEGSKIWQAHLIWESDRTNGRMPRTILMGDSK